MWEKKTKIFCKKQKYLASFRLVYKDRKKTEAVIILMIFLCLNVLGLYSIKSSTTHSYKSIKVYVQYIMPIPHVLSYDRWCVLAHIIDDF
jgi:hypothetical protein